MTSKPISIRRRIVTITITISLFAGISAFIAALLIGVQFSKRELTSQLNDIAYLMAQNAEPAFLHASTDHAQTQLNTLARIQHITQAELKHADGQLLAVYQRDNYNTSFIGNLLFGTLSVHQGVSVNNQYLGSLRITATAEPMVAGAKTYIVVALILLAILVGLANLLAFSLQKRISTPIKNCIRLSTALPITQVTFSSCQ